MLVLFVVTISFTISFSISTILEELHPTLQTIITAFLASMFIANKMLYDEVGHILNAKDKRAVISMLVSRDTQQMSESDIYKAGIETYAENLSDGVIAPLFYLALFGFEGVVIYKAINTLDSMVGYKTAKYNLYGRVSALLDDLVNFIPSRITAMLIMVLFMQKNIFSFYKDGKKHDSPNAGHPITAMAISLDVSLGGDTSYFGTLKEKAFFGCGVKLIELYHLQRALALRNRLDIVFYILSFLLFISYIF